MTNCTLQGEKDVGFFDFDSGYSIERDIAAIASGDTVGPKAKRHLTGGYLFVTHFEVQDSRSKRRNSWNCNRRLPVFPGMPLFPYPSRLEKSGL